MANTATVDLSSWDSAFEHLTAFTAVYGRAVVPQQFRTDSDFWLGKWVHNQRQRQRRGSMPLDLQVRLESLAGWQWNAGRGTAKVFVRPALPVAVIANMTVEQAAQTVATLKDAAASVASPPVGAARTSVPPIGAAVSSPDGVQVPSPRPGEEPLRGVAGIVMFLRANTKDLSAYLPRHPAHPDLRNTILELRKMKKRLTDGDVKLLNTVPGWTWAVDREDFVAWWNAYDTAARYGREHGHVRVGRDDKTGRNVEIRGWLAEQVRLYVPQGRLTISTLTTDRRRALEVLPGWDILLRSVGAEASMRSRMASARRAAFPAAS